MMNTKIIFFFYMFITSQKRIELNFFIKSPAAEKSFRSQLKLAFVEAVTIKYNLTTLVPFKPACGKWKKVWNWYNNKCKTQYRPELHEAFKTENITKERLVPKCCDGWSDVDSNCSKPVCMPHCVNGRCIGAFECSCDPGWKGSLCVDKCEFGYYGKHCFQKCQCNLTSATCDHVSGVCFCKAGYTGDNCKARCPVGTFGLDCQHTCECSLDSICGHVDGSCDCSSLIPPILPPSKIQFHAMNHSLDSSQNLYHGFSGKFCKTPCLLRNKEQDIEDYPERNAIPECIRDCTNCDTNKGGLCNPFTGECRCKSGFTGNSCNLKCSSKTYGKNCEKSCHCLNDAECDPISGECLCTEGWTGEKCQFPCQKGFYGKDCSHRCLCQHFSTCNAVDGSCLCSDGWTGGRCDQECPIGFYGQNCTHSCKCRVPKAICEPVFGDCICPEGFMGSYCEITCPSHFFGRNCAKKCECKYSSGCDSVTGSCHCQEGWYGSQCSLVCPQGRYGLNCNATCDCLDTSICHPVTGTCVCPEGKIGEKCSLDCSPGSFGLFCQFQCTCAGENSLGPCDKVSGACHCKSGFSALSNCSECDVGFFGENCSLPCPSSCLSETPCHRYTGQCVCDDMNTSAKECLHFKSSKFDVSQILDSLHNLPLAYVVAAVLGILFVSCLCGFLFFFITCSRKNHAKASSHKQAFPDLSTISSCHLLYQQSPHHLPPYNNHYSQEKIANGLCGMSNIFPNSASSIVNAPPPIYAYPKCDLQDRHKSSDYHVYHELNSLYSVEPLNESFYQGTYLYPSSLENPTSEENDTATNHSRLPLIPFSDSQSDVVPPPKSLESEQPKLDKDKSIIYHSTPQKVYSDGNLISVTNSP